MPDLVSRAVREGLYTHVVGRRIIYFPELPSTMDEAARLAQEGADEGTVVIAERQSAGRGTPRPELGVPAGEPAVVRYVSPQH